MTSPPTTLPQEVRPKVWHQNHSTLAVFGIGLFLTVAFTIRVAQDSSFAAVINAIIFATYFGRLVLNSQHYLLRVTRTEVTQHRHLRTQSLPITSTTIAHHYAIDRYNTPGIVLYDTNTHQHLVIKRPSNLLHTTIIDDCVTALNAANIPFVDALDRLIQHDNTFPAEKILSLAQGKPIPTLKKISYALALGGVWGLISWLSTIFPNT